MDKYLQAAQKIVREQELVIGPLARELARKAPGIKMEDTNVQIKGDPKEALSSLVYTYSQVFGRASIEVSRGVIKRMSEPFTAVELPEILK